MSRFDTLFSQLQNAKQSAFVPFVTLCDPTLERSFEIICTLVENGADALELGFPFSDPLLDGPVIQAANNRALAAGFSTDACFELLARVRSRYPNVPISLLLCANLVYAQGLDHFYQRCQEAGVDAVLIADVPLMAADPFIQSAVKFGIQPVFICPPNASEQTVADVAQYSQGYTYLVSRAGVTSAENQQHASNLHVLIEQLKRYNAPPILQGFGIATPVQVKDAIHAGCQGAISGSAIVNIIEHNLSSHQQCLTDLAHFVKSMKKAT
ncbi:tryptophan synthase subunit alpha [Spirabiliibacterium falconis]|uniref:tryptophan synthase subunit alpha n=1 Tax=Spirabiliibacterium falconis TaxID=572023 RepID=UPI001AAD2D24|nr:tryptophan synthase subunit alpha [Spirabiliibacterium falconis]MBE2894069.1 tryptophan synthase subunit alpha [Spirabiliibacterium falconis]